MPVTAACHLEMITATAIIKYASTNMLVSRGVNLVHPPVIICWFCFRFRKINKVAADVLIPILSKNMVKPKILSTPFPKKVMMIVINEKAVSPATSACVLGFLYENIFGNTLSSLIANITLGLLISKTFT